MKTTAIRLLPALLLLATAGHAATPSSPQAAPAASSAVTAELARLHGTWVVTAAEMGGKPFDDIVGGHLTIDGTRFNLVTATGNKLDGRISVDPAQSPKQLDLTLTAGAVWLAIYTVADKSLRLNYVEAADGDKRPTQFATSKELRGTVIAMRREEATH